MSSSIGLQLIILRLGLLENWKSAILGRLWELLGSTCVHPLVLGLQVYTTMLNFFVELGVLGIQIQFLELVEQTPLFIYLFEKVQGCVSITTIQFLEHLYLPQSPLVHTFWVFFPQCSPTSPLSSVGVTRVHTESEGANTGGD